MQNYSHENMDNVFMKIIYISVVFVHGISGFYDDFKPKNIEVLHTLPTNRSGNFSFKDCGEETSILNFNTVSILPDPIKLGRDINTYFNISGSYHLKSSIPKDLQLEVDLHVQMRGSHGYTEICEIIGEQRCHYDNILDILRIVDVNVNLTEGHHNFSYTLIRIPPIPFILRGTFETSIFIKQQGRPLGCLFVQFCTTECISY